MWDRIDCRPKGSRGMEATTCSLQETGRAEHLGSPLADLMPIGGAGVFPKSAVSPKCSRVSVACFPSVHSRADYVAPVWDPQHGPAQGLPGDWLAWEARIPLDLRLASPHRAWISGCCSWA